MKSLEELLTELGLADHMEALSNWRDDLLREKAEEIQTIHFEKDEAKSSALAELAGEKEAQIAALLPLKTLYEDMVPKVSAALASGDPELFIALGLDFITPEKEKLRAQLEAQLAALGD